MGEFADADATNRFLGRSLMGGMWILGLRVMRTGNADYRSHDLTVKAILTDNGTEYGSAAKTWDYLWA